MPPLLAPLIGIGLILMVVDNRARHSLARFSRLILIGLGMTQLFAFAWTLAVRPDVLDRIDGYRIYGVVANVLFGIGWVLLGISFMPRERRVPTTEAPTP
jgi:hypothetical protein